MKISTCLLGLVVATSWAQAQEAAPLVIDLSGGSPRELILITNGRAQRLSSTPLDGPLPTPGPRPEPAPGPGPQPVPPPSGIVASTYGQASMAAAAAGYESAATALEAGRSVKDALAEGARTTEQLRREAFARLVAPEFARVLPEGTEPVDPAQRAQVISLWRRFANDLRGLQP